MDIKLVGKNLILRPWQQSDRDSLIKYANNKNVSINLRDRFPFPYTVNDANLWLQIASQGIPLPNLAIEHQGEAVGGIGLIHGEDIYRLTAEVGYWLGEPHWGNGFATEALQLFSDYAFEKFGLVRLFAGVKESNVASARVLEKAGFIFEARQKKAVVKEGVIMDQLIYFKLKTT